MGYTTENTIEKRRARMAAALALREPDRVPFSPRFGKSIGQFGGVSNYEAMADIRNIYGSLRKLLSKYELDEFGAPALYPLNAMEILGTTHVKWPGASHGLDLNSSFQVLDRSYFDEDGYDEFLRDPSAFIFTKVFPDRHENLQGLRKLSLNNAMEFGHFASIGAFSEPDVVDALLTLISAGKEVRKWQQRTAGMAAVAEEMQCPAPRYAGHAMAYDMLADNLRGYVNVPMDLYSVPDKVLAATEYMHHLCKTAIAGYAAMGVEFVSIPLHGGTDEFLSDEQYKKHYWPFLRDMIEQICDLGMTPSVFCEGRYDTRLEVLREVPPGKVIYKFEKTESAKAKKALGDIACINGNFPTADLIFGKKEKIIEDTKRMLDECAPGGGFIMSCSIGLDNYDEALFEAWYEASLKYGQY